MTLERKCQLNCRSQDSGSGVLTPSRTTELCRTTPVPLCPEEAKLKHYYSTHCAQTGLPNLDLLLEHVEFTLRDSSSRHMVVLIINGVNEIGEHHGAAAGLHSLRTIAQRMRDIVGVHGYAARLQGNLFAAVGNNVLPGQFAQQLMNVLQQPIYWRGEPLQLITAAGVVNNIDLVGSAESMLQAGYAAAKAALTQNALGGIRQYTPELGNQLERQYQISQRLRHAATSGALSLAMQPKIDAASGRIVGAEALVRWQDDVLGSVSPGEFIPIAERTGSISSITTWVLQQALQEAASWHEQGLDLQVAVNLSAIDLRQPGLVARIKSALEVCRCPPEKLIIELTESAVAEDPVQAIAQLKALKNLGISLSLDDFGTGYSSLSYLRRFPIDTLKIDRSFVTDIPVDPDAVAIVQSILALAKTMGMKTVAEGVETEAQAQFLRDADVDVLQGYLFSKPVAKDKFIELSEMKFII